MPFQAWDKVKINGKISRGTSSKSAARDSDLGRGRVVVWSTTISDLRELNGACPTYVNKLVTNESCFSGAALKDETGAPAVGRVREAKPRV